MRQIIIDACMIKLLSLNDISTLLERNADNLRVMYISKMVEEGILQLMHPGEPNHPHQAYVVKH